MNDILNLFHDVLGICLNDTRRFELDLYLDEGNLNPKFFYKLEVLSYWRDRQDHYPNLSKIPYDVLSIPITIVASEFTFSFGPGSLTKYHSSILLENVTHFNSKLVQDYEVTQHYY